MKKEISWRAPEFIHYPKSALWFIALTVVGLGLTVYFAFRSEFLTAFLFLLFYLVILYYSKAKARVIEIRIDERGVAFGANTVPYSQIKFFWIVFDPPQVKTLNFETTAYLNRFVTLQLEDADAQQVREILSEHVAEHPDRGEQVADRVSRMLKF